MAVTVGFEPKEVHPASARFGQGARIHAVSGLTDFEFDRGRPGWIVFSCGQDVGTDPDTRLVVVNVRISTEIDRDDRENILSNLGHPR